MTIILAFYNIETLKFKLTPYLGVDMFSSACDAMKKSVMLSAFFLTIGVLLEVVTQFLSLESMVPVYFAYAGVFAIFLGVVGIFTVSVAVMIPSISQRLQSCQH